MFKVDDLDETRAPLLDHLIELRTRLIRALLALGVGFAVCLYFADEILGILVWPLKQAFPEGQGQLIFTKLPEVFFVELKVALFAGFMVSFPVIANQLWAFVAPGLYAREKKAFLPFLLATAAPVLAQAQVEMPEQAAAQAQKAVAEGAQVILGPVFAQEANAAGVAVAASGVNVLSFSNNSQIAGGNLFVLGPTFENTARRLAGHAVRNGKSKLMIDSGVSGSGKDLQITGSTTELTDNLVSKLTKRQDAQDAKIKVDE